MKHAEFEIVPAIDDNDAADRFSRSKPGESIVYFVGFLAIVRDGDGARAVKATRLAEYIWSLAQRGHVYLVQRRLGEKLYEYIAVRARAPA